MLETSYTAFERPTDISDGLQLDYSVLLEDILFVI